MRSRFALGLGLATTLTACGFNFQASDVVLDRRILSMVAEPPEIIIGQSDLSQPIQMKALVVDPADSGQPQSYEWRWCLPDFADKGNYDQVQQRCIANDASLLDQGSASLSQMATKIVPLTAADTLAPLLGNTLPSGSGMGSGNGVGLRGQGLATYLLMQLKVQPDASGKDVYGIKRVVLSTPGPGNRQPNKNPQLTALLFDDTPWEPDAPRAITVKQCSADKQTQIDDPNAPKDANGNTARVTVCEHRITPVFDASQSENYEVVTIDKNPDGSPVTENLKERLRFGWVTDNGTFTVPATGQPSSIGPHDYDPLSTKWVEPPEVTKTDVTVWVVVRDGRGGESWETRHLTLSK